LRPVAYELLTIIGPLVLRRHRMAMQGHFAEPAQIGDERRASLRRALRLDIQGAGAAHGAARVTIHDLSLTGVLIETSTPLSSGETFEVELPQAGKVEASVVWAGGEFYGCEFKEPISTAALSAAFLRNPPRDAPLVSGTVADDLASELRSINEQVERIGREVERVVDRLAGKTDEQG
jgi:hypothetical protein